MAQIDVTDLLTDPDFVDKIQLIDRKPVVNTRGENLLTECVTDSVGSVQPADGHTIARLPEDLQTSNVSSFWFKGVIVATAPGKYSSILVFKGMRYQVKMVNEWSNWGAGYCEGVCVAEVPA